jgi:hypothetical protein
MYAQIKFYKTCRKRLVLKTSESNTKHVPRRGLQFLASCLHALDV